MGSEPTKHTALVTRAREAMQDVEADTSVDAAQTLVSLEELQAELDSMVRALQEQTDDY